MFYPEGRFEGRNFDNLFISNLFRDIQLYYKYYARLLETFSFAATNRKSLEQNSIF